MELQQILMETFHENPKNDRTWDSFGGGTDSPKIRNNFIDGRLQHSNCGRGAGWFMDPGDGGKNTTKTMDIGGCFQQPGGKAGGDDEGPHNIEGPQYGTYRGSYSPYYE